MVPKVDQPIFGTMSFLDIIGCPSVMETKFEEVIRVIENRLTAGDFRLKRMPSSRKLAEEVGVSRNTARRAISELMAKGVLVRKSSGRIDLRTEKEDRKVTRIAFLAPAFYAPTIIQMQQAVSLAAEGLPVTVRPVTYVHWDDPAIVDTLRGFDGVFLYACSDPGPLPSHIAERLANRDRPVATLFTSDMSELGIPTLTNGSLTVPILEYAESIGHRSFVFLNTEPHIQGTYSRINVWREWMQSRGYKGQLIDQPVASYAHGLPHTYQIMSKLLDDKKITETCIVTTSTAAAEGAMRAMCERGIRLGRKTSLCIADIGEFAEYRWPSITCMKMPDYVPDVRRLLKWMISGTLLPEGPVLVKYRPEIFKGETTENP